MVLGYVTNFMAAITMDVQYALRIGPRLFRVNIGNKTNDLILNLTPENVTQHSRIVTTTHKGSSTPTKMSKIIGRQIH